jgi:hypothetical protein
MSDRRLLRLIRAPREGQTPASFTLGSVVEIAL